MKLLLYCTKSKPYLNNYKLTNHNKRYFISNTGLWSVNPSTQQIYSTNLNGKVVAECDFEVSKIEMDLIHYDVPFDYLASHYHTTSHQPFKYFSYLDLSEATCLQEKEMLQYLGGKNGYAIHIKNLHIFDEPRPTKWYGYTDKKGYLCMVEKAPQNMMYCYDEFGNDYVLISIRPEWLCKILNGEKTIEIRKKILRGML